VPRQTALSLDRAARHVVRNPSGAASDPHPRRHPMFFRILFSLLLPPLGVFLTVGLGKHFWLNLLLTLLGYVPGIVHAVWLISRDTNEVPAHGH
jgi:uncharacterized membrane protein YqaE (UPF0057 family)